MIVVCGEALVDFTPTPVGDGEAYVPRAGGSPLNVAVTLARLEAPAAFLGRLSRDFFGQLLRRHLVINGVDLRYLKDGPELTSLAFVHLVPGEEPAYRFYLENSADRGLLPEHLPPAFPNEVQALHFGSLSLVLEPGASTLEHCMRREREARVISLDPNVRPGLIVDHEAYMRRLDGWVRLADIVKVSVADLAWLHPGEEPERVARGWLERGPSLVAVTAGVDGCAGFTRDQTVRVPGLAVQVVDTVGAGDAYMGGLLARLQHRGWLARARLAGLTATELTEVLSFANRASALTCARAGADPPYRSEVDGGSPAAI